jgi:hypothetical protein
MITSLISLPQLEHIKLDRFVVIYRKYGVDKQEIIIHFGVVRRADKTDICISSLDMQL